ncbi:MAG: RDD family protein [Bacteroidia bacterium]|nr:RDD family protein [Bacteroidia bacterium]
MSNSINDPFENSSSEEHLLNREDFAADLMVLDTASGGTRFANYLIDSLGIWLFQTFGLGYLVENFFLNNLITDYDSYAYTSVILGIYFLSAFLYYAMFEIIFEKTPGKFLTKTKVVNLQGGKAETKDILLRSIIRYVPFEAFSFLGDSAIGWHDSWSKTRVVRG